MKLTELHAFPLLAFLHANAKWLSAGTLLAFLSSFGQTFFISVFSEQIRADLGLSHTSWGLYYAIGTGASAVVMVWAGGLTDTVRVRDLGVAALVLLVAACLAMAAVPGAWAVPFVIFFLRFSGQGMISHIAAVAMAKWFIAARGKAMSIAALGFAMGQAVLPVICVALMVFVDWRFIWVGCAVLILAMLPVLRWLLAFERTPNSQDVRGEAAGMDGLHWSRRKVLKTPIFWMAVPTILGPSSFVTAFFFHHAYFASTKDWSHSGLVALFPLFTGVSVITMLITGWAIDRFGATRLMPIYKIPLAMAFFVLSITDALSGAAIAMILLGLATGMNSTLPGAFWAELYGTRYLGSIKALAAAVMVLGSAIGPGLTGALIDAGQTLSTQFGWIAIYFVFASGLIAYAVFPAHRRLARAP